MTTIGNCFAMLVIAITMLMFFTNRNHITKASHYYTVTLILTLGTAWIDIVKSEAINRFSTAPWVTKLITTIDYAAILLTTSFLALYLICKVCEHSLNESNFFYAKLSIIIIYSLICTMLLLNLPFGFIFKSTAETPLILGEAYFLPYFTMIPQAFVVICYAIKYRKSSSNSVNHALIEAIFAVALCAVIKMLYKEISISIMAIVLIELIFFLNFQNYKLGVNPLTNLNGERSFMKEVNHQISKKKSFKVYLIHVNNLTAIKQSHGHKVGNEILWHFALGLDKLFFNGRAYNLYAAIFAVLLPVKKDGEEDTATLLSYLESTINYADMPIKINYTVAEHQWSGESDADVLHEKLEFAIDNARNSKINYKKYNNELEMMRLRKKMLIERTKTVSKSEGFEVWYQPIFSVRKGKFSSMEALLRLREKDGSYISPADFIPIAEKTGQIVPITLFVIEESCRTLASYPELGGMRISINLPMIQLADPYFAKTLNAIVDKYGISHDKISFEFTERVILDDLTVAEKTMRRLARSGYTFYLDDFGVGHSNFECVLRLPLKTIKLDMSLTLTTERLRANYGLVKVLTDLFHDMGMNVVAEGAETEEQVEILRSYGVDGIQGYYYSKPRPIDDLIEIIREQ